MARVALLLACFVFQFMFSGIRGSTWLSTPEAESTKAKLKKDLGYKTKIYLDHEDNPAFGYRHRVMVDDPEYKWKVGRDVSMERIDAAFNDDFRVVVKALTILLPTFDLFPDDAKLFLISNLMDPEDIQTTVKKVVAAVTAGDWHGALDEVMNSNYFKGAAEIINNVYALAQNGTKSDQKEEL